MIFAEQLTRLGVLTSHPTAFLLVIAYTALWWVFSPATLDWHALATLSTLAMTLFIQRAEHRDTQAIHAKLDELLRADGRARNEVIAMDDEEPEVIEERRSEARKGS